jgi:hypothetical protein
MIETKVRTRFGSGLIDYKGNKLLFGGRIWDSQPLRHARGAIDAMRSRLGEHLPRCRVTGLIVFLDDWEVCSHNAEVDVAVLASAQLDDYFAQQHSELTSDEVCSISSFLKGVNDPAILRR